MQGMQVLYIWEDYWAFWAVSGVYADGKEELLKKLQICLQL